MGLAVVGEGTACGGDDDLLGRVGHRDGAQLLGHDLVVTGLGSAVEGELVGVLGAADLGLGTDGLEAIGLALDDALDRAVGHGVGGAVVDEGVGAGRDGQRGGRDLIGTGDGAGVVAFAGDGHGDGTGDVGEVVGAVGDRVVGALGKRLLTVGHGRRPLVGLAIVDDVLGRVDAHAVLVGGGDVLGRDAEVAEGLGRDLVVAGLGAAPRNRIGVLCAADLGDGTVGLDRCGLAVLETIERPAVGLGKRRSVIGLGGRCSGDAQRSRRDHAGHVDAAVVVPLTGHGHADGADIGRVLREGQLVVGALSEDVAVLVRDGGLLLLRSSVVDDVRRRLDPDAPVGRVVRVDGLGGHGEGAEVLGDGVVGLLGRAGPVDGVGVVALLAADLGLGAGHAEVQGLAVLEALVGRVRRVGRERGAVVNLGRARRGHRERGGGHLDDAVDPPDVELGRDILALSVADNEFVGRGGDVVGRDVGRVRRGLSGLDGVALGQLAHRDGSAVGLAVVGEGAARGGDDDLLGALGDGQGADALRIELVVLGHLVAREVERVAVAGGADLGLGAGHREGGVGGVDKALDLAGGGERLAVVDLGVGLGRDRVPLRVDLVGAGDLAGVVAEALDRHGDEAGNVGTVLGAVRHRVVSACDEGLVVVLDGRGPGLVVAVVRDVGGGVDAHAVLVGGRDVLGLDRELAEAGLDAEVAGSEAILPAVGDRVRDLALGNGSHPTGSLEVVDLALEELGRAGDAHRGVALRLAGVGELTRVGAEGDRGGRDLIGTRHRSGVVALAGDGHGDGVGDVGEVVGAVGHVVVGALDELAAGLVGDGRDPLVLVAVVDDVARAVDLDAVIGARRRVVRVDGLGGHREGAVNLADLVVVQVGVLPGLNHVSVRRAAHGGLLAAEVVGKALAIDKRALGHISLVLGKRRAVINLGVARRGNGHGTPGDLKGRLAGGNVTELVGHVLACGVLDGIGVDFRGGVADISDGALGRGLERIAGGQPVRGHARARELGAVIRLAGALGHYDDASRALGDFEGAGLLGDGVVGLLGVVVPVDGIGIGARANGGLGAGHGERRGLAVDKAGDLALGGESGAVVLLARAARRHVERGGRDLDRAGLLGDVELIRNVLALRVDDDELVDVSGNILANGHIGCCRVGVSRLDRVALGQAGHGDVDAVRLAVIDAAVVTGSGNDDIGGLGNGEGTEPLADGVVGLLGSSGPIDGVGVGAGADFGLGAGRPEVGGLAVDETGDVAPCGERLPVVDLRAGRGPHVQRSRSDLVLHFDAACIVALAGHGHGHGPGIGLVGREGEVIVDTLLKGLLAVLDLRLLGLLGAVVRDVRKRADRHLVVLVV